MVSASGGCVLLEAWCVCGMFSKDEALLLAFDVRSAVVGAGRDAVAGVSLAQLGAVVQRLGGVRAPLWAVYFLPFRGAHEAGAAAAGGRDRLLRVRAREHAASGHTDRVGCVCSFTDPSVH